MSTKYLCDFCGTVLKSRRYILSISDGGNNWIFHREDICTKCIEEIKALKKVLVIKEMEDDRDKSEGSGITDKAGI